MGESTALSTYRYVYVICTCVTYNTSGGARAVVQRSTDSFLSLAACEKANTHNQHWLTSTRFSPFSAQATISMIQVQRCSKLTQDNRSRSYMWPVGGTSAREALNEGLFSLTLARMRGLL